MTHTDTIYIQSDMKIEDLTRELCEIMFDEYEIQVTKSDDVIVDTTVTQNNIVIDGLYFNPPQFLKESSKKRFGFVPNIYICLQHMLSGKVQSSRVN